MECGGGSGGIPLNLHRNTPQLSQAHHKSPSFNTFTIAVVMLLKNALLCVSKIAINFISSS